MNETQETEQAPSSVLPANEEALLEEFGVLIAAEYYYSTS